MAAARNGGAFIATNAYLESRHARVSKALASNQCRHFCWPRRMARIVSPTGFRMETMAANNVFALSSSGAMLPSTPPKPYPMLSKAECCLHYLFDAALKPNQWCLNWSNSSSSLVCYTKGMWTGGRKINGFAKAAFKDTYAEEPSRKCILLDIEGTTTPISFVTDVLFPYARDNVRKHLYATYDSEETQDDIKLLRAQVKDDLEQGIDGSVPIPPADADKDSVIDSLVANVEAMIKADRKITALKQLQGHIWRTGFESKEIQGVVFEDVPEAFKRWHAMGIKVYIYSSGSREAQRLIFGNTGYGDLRKYLCGFFDNMMGNKKESRSYFEICQSVGVDKPSQILFLTDVFQEAVAAEEAGRPICGSFKKT